MGVRQVCPGSLSSRGQSSPWPTLAASLAPAQFPAPLSQARPFPREDQELRGANPGDRRVTMKSGLGVSCASSSGSLSQ